MSSLEEFLKSKEISFKPSGFEVSDSELNPVLFPFQRDIVRLALRMGKMLMCESYGLGKSLQVLEWSRHVAQYTGGSVLIPAPLAVSPQFEEEGQKFGIECKYVRNQSEIKSDGIYTTNYDSLDKFDGSFFAGVALDESACLKSAESKRFEMFCEMFQNTPYKIGASALPAPNQTDELGSQAEFLGIMSKREMQAEFFTHDGGDTSKWVLKPWAEKDFWSWVASWMVYVTKPSDVDPSYDDTPYQLPHHNIEHVKLNNHIDPPDDRLVWAEATTLKEQRYVSDRCIHLAIEQAAKIASGDEQCVIWCYTNDQSRELAKSIDGAVEVKGSDTPAKKEAAIRGFKDGSIRKIVIKPSIGGWGINWQNCHRQVFVGMNHSLEQLIQAMHRIYRFGQDHPVDTYIVAHHLEGAILRNIERKMQETERMEQGMLKAMAEVNHALLKGVSPNRLDYNPTMPMILPKWLAA